MNKNAPFLRRLSNALKGIRSTWIKESSFRIQSVCAVLLLIFCVAVRPSAVWCALFTFAVVLVLALEALNTALEAFIDKMHPGFDPQIGFVKDCLAGAVLIASIGSLIILASFLSTL